MPLSAPTQIVTPWATSGLKNTIPQTANPVTGNAGYDQGFTATNMTAKEAGGIPPFGQDFNGIFYDITQAIQFIEAGGSFPYNSTFATAIGGYPLGALVQRSDGSGFWRNFVANNTTNPETGGAGWQPESSGSTSVVMTNSNITLTALQAAKNIVVITGTLVANLQLIFPNYVKTWNVINLTSGSFSITAKTSAGSGVVVSQSSATSIVGDGTNIYSAGIPSSLLTSGIAGDAYNLKASSNGTNSTVIATADSICLKNASNEQVVVNAMSLSINSAASGANGLDTGSLAFSTWYHVWAIWNGTTTAGLLSLSQTAPTLPSGYTHKGYIGAIFTDGTNKFPLSFKQDGNLVRYKVVSGSNVASYPIAASGSAGSATTPTYVSVNLSNYIPPNARAIIIMYSHLASDVSVNAIVSSNNQTGPLNSATNPPEWAFTNNANGGTSSYPVRIQLETYAVFWANNNGNGRLRVIGWEF